MDFRTAILLAISIVLLVGVIAFVIVGAVELALRIDRLWFSILLSALGILVFVGVFTFVFMSSIET